MRNPPPPSVARRGLALREGGVDRYGKGMLKQSLLPSLALASLVFAAQACSEETTSTPNPTTDAGTTTDSGDTDGGGSTVGEKIDAPAGSWTWVPFADSSCANGSPTGIGVNPGTSKRVVIFLEGGGACWEATTCYVLTTAANIDKGFGEADFTKRMADPSGSHFDRTDASNPYKDASFVYVPYCTGDVHSGNKENTYDGKLTKHVGRKNLEAFLKRIVPTFPDPERVTLTGSSAGGFGAAINYWRVAEAFGGKRVDLVDDSGPSFPVAKIPYYKAWSAAWDLEGAAPPDCPACKTELSAVIPHYVTKFPSSRFALLSYTEDSTIRQFFGSMPPADFAATLNEVGTKDFDPTSNARYFFVSGQTHTMLGKLSTESNNTQLGTWLTAMDTDSASWASVKPPTVGD